jgi:tetratricopeptide (TPR) repeat protein
VIRLTDELQGSLSELGRMYYHLGYLTPAERVFSGLLAYQPQDGWSRLALALIKGERGQTEEGKNLLRPLLQDPKYFLQAKIILVSLFLSEQEVSRARSMFDEIRKSIPQNLADFPRELQSLLRGIELRLGVGE